MSIKRSLTIMSILVSLVFTDKIWVYHKYPDKEITFAMESKKESTEKELLENTHNLSNQIMSELTKENYEITGVGIHHQFNEINIKISGTKQYVESIEKNIKKVVSNLAQQTVFKDYSIEVYNEIISTPVANPWFEQER